MDKTTVITISKKYKTEVQRILPDAKVFLYGSYAKGTANENSDIDLAIVVNKTPQNWLIVTPLLWRISYKINSLIEPILIATDQLETPLSNDIIKHGIEI